MTAIAPSPTLADVLRGRRERLAQLIHFPAVLWSGQSSPRNFPANVYPFRASSHFLYFAGLPLDECRHSARREAVDVIYG
jgi:Xaa-Pro aminopeptidase